MSLVGIKSENRQAVAEILSFVDEHGTDNMKQDIENNYRKIKSDIVHNVESEMERIKNDPNLQHLVQQG